MPLPSQKTSARRPPPILGLPKFLTLLKCSINGQAGNLLQINEKRIAKLYIRDISYFNKDEDAVASVNTVDIHFIKWKENLREGEPQKHAEANVNFETERPELKTQSGQDALYLVDNLKICSKSAAKGLEMY